MKKLISILALLVCVSCTIQQTAKYQTTFDNTVKFEYVKTIENSTQINSEQISGLIYIHDNHLLIKQEASLFNDIRYNFKKQRPNNKYMKRWVAYPFGQERTKVYIEYKLDAYVLIYYPKQNKSYFYLKENSHW